MRLWAFMAACLVVALASVVQAGPAYTPVTDQMLVKPPAGDWLMFRGSYNGWGYSPLQQIDTSNVKELVPVWTFSTGVTEGHEAPPIVHDGIMFVTTPYNRLYALDAKTGDLLWKYERQLPEDVFPLVCCDVVNRGVALYGDKVYMGTLDSHLIAFDARTGKTVWDRTVGDYKVGEIITSPPLVVKGKVITGVHGGEFGVRGFLQAFDAETGRSLWKTYTTPGPGEPGHDTWSGDAWMHGGAAPWYVGTYDPELDVVYWGTSNASPWLGEARPGDNLYTASALALDPDTGKIRYHFQYTPHDVWDYDGVNELVLADLTVDGRKVRAALHANRNGYYYILDRTDLAFVKATPFVHVSAVRSVDPKTGRPQYDPQATPALGKQVSACPGFLGGKNWSPMAYNPQTGLLYIPSNEWCMDIKGIQVSYLAGQPYVGAEFEMKPVPQLDHIGKLQAVDPATGRQVWSQRFQIPIWGGVLTTAGGLTFYGTPDRYFRAYDAKTGKVLWQFRTNSGVAGVPSTFEVDGVQYVAVQSGWGGAVPLWGGPIVQRVRDVPKGGVIWVFALRDKVR
ncbi:methanol/ethanol family PQQ-dependent dehydrogenase [Carboxydochorda subterranea]|uniref:Methanol/ethanol family PQQ-dependent dehydrogenase n=1 Tax=Carboxydichorda subterranea TaxID=3109565 RepID=A0ABZ1BUJ6_9FIRM|nr:methanol/ethanol family PQQ-dependent dehydrogenase [Limnochorda sp. L945t]WRP16160.1 methanol/ethanol family PQQ-dependent dehydrogenase [Limnochorda sp. L945t]